MAANDTCYLEIIGGLKCLYGVMSYVAVSYHGSPYLLHVFLLLIV